MWLKLPNQRFINFDHVTEVSVHTQRNGEIDGLIIGYCIKVILNGRHREIFSSKVDVDCQDAVRLLLTSARPAGDRFELVVRKNKVDLVAIKP